MKTPLNNRVDTMTQLTNNGNNGVAVGVDILKLEKNALHSPPFTGGSRAGSSSHSGTMADDDLEYHITFPSPTVTGNGSKLSLDDEAEEFVYVNSTSTERKEPVIVLLGWYACQDRHLAKYSKIYEDIGCITIRFTPRPDVILYQPENMRSIASKLLEVVMDYNLEEHPIIMHMFSNGGCYMYRHISDLVSTNTSTEKNLQIRGCVFDSGPAVNSPLNLFRAITAATRGNVAYRWTRGVVLMVVVFFAALTEFLLGLIWAERRRNAPQAMWANLAKDPLRCPQLFLYSRADKICNHKSIKSFAEVRRQCGVPVLEVCWEDSPHVKHFIVHRAEYVDRVITFVDVCLGGDAAALMLELGPAHVGVVIEAATPTPSVEEEEGGDYAAADTDEARSTAPHTPETTEKMAAVAGRS